jgi:hypothetical protein
MRGSAAAARASVSSQIFHGGGVNSRNPPRPKAMRDFRNFFFGCGKNLLEIFRPLSQTVGLWMVFFPRLLRRFIGNFTRENSGFPGYPFF